jgi:hypothetical protein
MRSSMGGGMRMISLVWGPRIGAWVIRCGILSESLIKAKSMKAIYSDFLNLIARPLSIG